jgi:hypothetical protein
MAMKRKAKVRRSRDLPPPDMSETPVELSSAPAKPGRISIESVDEHKTGSIESVPQTGPENGVAGFIEPGGSDAEGARSPNLPP